MKALFQTIYELIGQPQPPADTPVYRDVIFPNLGLLNWGLSLALVLLFYLGINRAMGVATFNKGRHWGIFLALNAVLAFVITLWQTSAQQATQHSYIYWLATWNAVLSMLWFFLFSLLLKRTSTNASTTPF
ncbi:hypothetical protein FY528_03345 [Hymenobacter lutimineralis]|uniref:Uncharacterized protein n=2 Tax=Hymenobacter TaxID=89966 RepID=A0A5D6VDM9_9BACT|nr:MULTISPECIES: hypothetical protein [Hymenobacter]MBG8553168.1 hypothetical protein [Hymenobacter guriensis]MCR5887842.1 hypothetical protein [Hymenobacter sp. J193]QIX61237.1 hypothetical protein HER32_08625 [Hymenobacter sp. BT18]TYZ13455.1 hypothetical protein FY528_03345 [Hymenobacter lutimineralis]